MGERDTIELYKKNIEMLLSTLNIFKCETKVNINERIKEENIKFLKKEMLKIYSGNCNEKLLEKAINELYPYLKEFDLN